MKCFKCASLLIILFFLQFHESETSCEIVQTHISSSQESCNTTFYFKVDYSCNIDNQLRSVKVIEKKESDSSKLLCSITYSGGKCDHQPGCTCSTPQRFSVTRHAKVSQQFEWEITAQLKNGTLIPNSMNLHINCDKPKNDVTDNTLVNDTSHTTSVNAASETVLITVAVCASFAVIVVAISATLIILRRRKRSRVRQYAMSARQEPRVQNESRPDGREQHHDADAASVMHNNSFYASRSVCGEYADVQDQIKTVRPASRMYEGGRVYDEIQDSESDEEGATGGQDMYVDPFDVKKKKAAQGKNPGMRPMTRQ